MHISGTILSYYLICHRKVWLFDKRIDMEHNSEAVEIGRNIADSTYSRERHDIFIQAEDGDIALDFYDAKKRIIHEVKKSDSMEEIHVWQVKYYIAALEGKGITGVTGEIDYPKLKQKVFVNLSDTDRYELNRIKGEIRSILQMTAPPDVINMPYCKKCSYYDLCYI